MCVNLTFHYFGYPLSKWLWSIPPVLNPLPFLAHILAVDNELTVSLHNAHDGTSKTGIKFMEIY